MRLGNVEEGQQYLLFTKSIQRTPPRQQIWPGQLTLTTKTGHNSLLISISYFYIYYWKLPSEQENQTI